MQERSRFQLKETDDKERPDEDMGRSSLRWMSAGIEFCGVIGVFCFIGYKIDQRFSTSPLLLLTGFFIGFIGMVYLFYKESKK
jgi:F0F1-type ATP synthase assembly protein I